MSFCPGLRRFTRLSGRLGQIVGYDTACADCRRAAMWPALAFPRALGSSAARLRNTLVNQNLLYLVFMCLMNTKHSGSGRALQAVFNAQEGGPKRTRKTGLCGALAGISNDNPPVIHRCVHRARRRRTVIRRCRFATHAFMLQCTSCVANYRNGAGMPPIASVRPHRRSA